jgi:hypothetical protein
MTARYVDYGEAPGALGEEHRVHLALLHDSASYDYVDFVGILSSPGMLEGKLTWSGYGHGFFVVDITLLKAP